RTLDEAPPIDLAITTGRASGLPPPERYRGCWICSTPTLGRGLTEIRMKCRGGRGVQDLSVAERMLGPEIQADPQVERQVVQHLKSRGVAAPAPDPGILAALQEGLKAAQKSEGTCQSCHREQSEQWVKSKHALAWHSLAAKGDDRDATCIPCHTTPLLS